MKTTLFILFLSLIGLSSAQTKIIAHKSHSGNTHNFSKAYQKNLFEMGHSNFGHQMQVTVKNALLDSLIFVNDTCQIMITSEVCRNKFGGEKSSVWKAGRDTVYNHPLFLKQHALDSIKTVLKNQYYFKNDIENTVFIGYSNSKPIINRSNSSIRVKEMLVENGFVNVTLNGVFMTDGNCVANLLVGIESYHPETLSWHLLIDVFQTQNDCGPSSVAYYQHNTSFNIHELWRQSQPSSSQKFLPPGTYRLVVKELPTNTFIHSNEFHFK
jgi:hypothetical protein